MRIIDLSESESDVIADIAQMLIDGFEGLSWPDVSSALAEVNASFGDGRISRVALDEEATVLGWIGGNRQYDGYVWELHPLVVSPARRRRGIGAALVADFERCVVNRGGETVILGTDDLTNRTSLGGVDLYPDVAGHISNIRNLNSHPFEFYEKQGYVIVGVIPDANGYGKPDITMAKRVGARAVPHAPGGSP